MDIQEAIRNILDGEAILFTGSGFSANAEKVDGNRLCTARVLAHQLLLECGFSKDEFVDDLGLASEIYEAQKGSLGLLEFVKREFTAAKLSPAQQFIATLPWFRIYTTNYDNVLEKAWQDAGKRLNTAVLSDRQDLYQDKRTLCVCLNGSVTRLSEEKLTEEVKLTNSSYLTDSFRSSPWLSFFQTDLKTAKAIFFIGYSMQYDLDIKRVVFENKELHDKSFFIMWEKEPKANVMLVQKFGTPIPIGLEAFMNMVREEQKSYRVVKPMSKSLLCFDKVEVSKAIPSVTDREAFDLLLKGNMGSWDKIYYSLTSPTSVPFCIHRTALNAVMVQIKDGERNIVVHSSLGNGKTMFMMSLATLLSRSGYKVYYFRRYRTTLAREIESICETATPTVILFDRYADCIPYLETFKSFRTDQILIIADRSAMNDICYGKVASLFGDFATTDLNELDDTEISLLCVLLTRYGLWGDKSYLRDDQKREFIAHDCRRSISKTIIQLLHSPSILGEYKRLIEDIRNKKGYYDALIYILISQVAGFDVDTDDLVNIFDASQLNSPSFRNNASVREFIDFDGNQVKRTSSLFARVLLEEIFNTDVIVDVMIGIYRRLNDQRSRREVRSVLRKMMTYSNMQNILNKNDRNYKANLLHYYDSIHTLSFCAENPHFWMQYAILKLSEYDYVTAQVYFENAYSFAKKQKDYDTYQIDNHYARHILENEVANGSQASCMKAFEEAHNSLMNPKHKVDSYYYPYRVAQKYYPFYEKYFKGMNKNEQTFFLTACVSMLKRIEWYLSSTTTQEGRMDVIRAKEFMERILSGQ